MPRTGVRDFTETADTPVKMVLISVEELRQLSELADRAMAVRPAGRWNEADVSRMRAPIRAIQGKLRAWQRGQR